MIIQAGVTSKWTKDSQHFLLEHFDTIHDSPSHIYHSALPFCPSSSWLHKYYSAELSHMVKVVKGLPAEWGKCSRTVLLKSLIRALSLWDNTVAVGSEHGDIIILDAITGSQTAVFSGHINRIDCLTFSLNGIFLASASYDKTVKLWDMQTGGIVRTFSGHSHLVWSVSISADCTTIASGSHDESIRLWDFQTGKCHHIIEQQSYVNHVIFSPTNPQLLISISDNIIWHWDTNGHQIKPSYKGSHMGFSSDGTQFVSCNGAAITIQNSHSGVIVTKFYVAESNTEYCCFSPNDKLVAVAAGNNAYIWDIGNSEPHLVETFIGHTNQITTLAFSSPSSLISTSSDRSVKFWQIGTLPTSSVVTDLIWSVSLQAEGGIVISSDVDGTVKTWDISTGLCKASFQTPAKNSHKRDIQLINSRLIVVWYTGEEIKVWDVERGELLWGVNGPQQNVVDLRISGDGSKIFYVGQSNIQAWNVWTGEAMKGGGDVDYPTAKLYAMDNSKVWISQPWGNPWGLDFGGPGSSPLGLSSMPSDKPHPNGTKIWDSSLSRVKDIVTGKVVFQLPTRFGTPIYMQWNGQHLGAGLESREVLVLEFPPTFFQ